MYMGIANVFFILGTLLITAILIYMIGKGVYCFIEDKKQTSATYDIVRFLKFDDEFTDNFKGFELVPEFFIVAISWFGHVVLCFVWPTYIIIVGMFYFRTKKRKEKLKDN